MYTLRVLYLSMCFGVVLSKPGFLPDNPYLFWTTNTNNVQYVNNTEKWIQENEPPNTFAFSYGPQLHKHLGCSYDFERGFLLFSENSANTISLLGERNDGKTQGSFVHIGTSSGVGHVAVDWISSNVYWSDSLYGWIGLQALPIKIEGSAFNRKFRVVVDKFLDVPSGLAVHANKRFLFWTDTGTEPKIERSLLDGSDRRVLVWSGVLKPVSVAVDVHSNTLYFTDPARETVESCDLEGNARRILYYETNSVFYGIETFKNYVIVSDQSSGRILVLSNSTGQKSVTPLKAAFVPFSLGLFAQDNQPVISTACDTLGCDQICIYTTSGAQCLCEDGYSLLPDNKTCNEIDKTLQRSLLFASESRICHLPVNAINFYKYVSITIKCDIIAQISGNVSYFAIAMETNEIFFAKENTIFRQDMFENAITSNFSSLYKISGLDYNWLTHTLYWSEQSVDKIFFCNLTSDQISRTGEITSPSLGFPKALKVDPFKKRIFYIDSSTTQSIKVIYLMENRVDTLESYGITSPAYIHYDRRKDTIFWSDNGRSALGSVRSDGSNAKFKELPQGSTYSGITVYKDYLLWLSNDHSKHVLDVLENTSLSSETHASVNISVSSVLDLRVFDRSLQPSVKEPCITDNDGCQHICIVQGQSSQCACRMGYTLQFDRKSCLSAPVASHFLLTTDIQMNRLFQINNNSTDINTVDILAGNPRLPDYDDIRGELFWWDKNKNTIMKSSFDGKNGKAIKGGVQGVGGLAVDHTTGNIFYASDDNIYVTTSSGNANRKLASGTNVGTIQVDSKRGVMVWIEGRPYPKIVRSYMDGTNMETVISNATNSIVTPMDLSIDSSDGSLVWCDDTLDKIDIVSMSTLTSRTVISNRGEYPVSVAVLGEYIYYIAKDRRSITKISKITGSKPTALVSSPLFGKLVHLAIYEDNKQRLHKLCYNQNGLCSKFCLPRGENSKTCACNDGEQVESGGLCPGDVQCPSTIHQGTILTTCRRLTGDMCQFTCDQGYEIGVPGGTRVFCGSNGKWNETNDLCTVKKCQGSFENGNIASGCSLEVGTTCGYTCHGGYLKSGSMSLVCNKNGAWNEELGHLCKLEEKENNAALIGAITGSSFGIVLIIAVIVVCVLFRRNKRANSSDRLPESSGPYVCATVDGSVLSGSQMSTYTTLTDDGGSVYSEIKEERGWYTEDQPKTVEIPPLPYKNHPDGMGTSFKSERYARFPRKCEGGEKEGGYLDPYYSGNYPEGRQAPDPDYDVDDQFTGGPRGGYLDVVQSIGKSKDGGMRFQRMPRGTNSNNYNNDYFT